ncbi:MAG: hypothetical protein ABR915_21835 [Thermoguttaceae bacterium]
MRKLSILAAVLFLTATMAGCGCCPKLCQGARAQPCQPACVVPCQPACAAPCATYPGPCSSCDSCAGATVVSPAPAVYGPTP